MAKAGTNGSSIPGRPNMKLILVTRVATVRINISGALLWPILLLMALPSVAKSSLVNGGAADDYQHCLLVHISLKQ